MSTGERWDVLTGTSRSATGACTFLSLRRTFISLAEMCFQTNIRKTTGLSIICYFAKEPDNGHATPIGLSTDMCGRFEEMELCSV